MTLIDIELNENEFEKISSAIQFKLLEIKPILTTPTMPFTLSKHTTGDEV